MTDDRLILITGISGFIARQTAVAFLRAGYRVRGTVREARRADEVRTSLASHADVERLEFAVADLNSDTGWREAAAGAWGVAHMASPFPLGMPRNDDELVRPAVDGTLRVLAAARDAGVARFVQTSSVAAIGYGHARDRTAPFTAEDWTNLEGPGVGAYVKSKTLAERAARAFVAEHAPAMHFATVNPSLVLGPPLDREIGTSVELVRLLLIGKYPAVPRLSFGIVDARDVAALHVLAMETTQPSGGRYIASDATMSFRDICMVLRQRLGPEARKVPTRQLPDFLFRLLALFDSGARQVAPELGKAVAYDSTATTAALGHRFTPAGDAVEAAARMLITLGLAR